MADDAVTKTLAGAKAALAKANQFTQSAEGTSTSSFAPKSETAPESTKSPMPSYKQAHKARGGVSGLAEQAGGENTAPREGAMKALTQ